MPTGLGGFPSDFDFQGPPPIHTDSEKGRPRSATEGVQLPPSKELPKGQAEIDPSESLGKGSLQRLIQTNGDY